MGFKPHQATLEDWERYHGYRGVRHAEVRPDDPLIPDDIAEAHMKRDEEDPFWHACFYAALSDEKIIGFFRAFARKPDDPAYATNKHLMNANGAVLKRYRRRGIGTMWLRKMLELMKEWDRTVLTTWTEEDDGRAFLNWAGAKVKSNGAENRLDFRQIDWGMIERWIVEGHEKSSDTKLELYENRLPEKFLDELCPILTAILNTMPWDDLDHGEIVLTPELIREEYKRLDDMKGQHHTHITREPNGEISGITDVLWIPSQPTYILQRFTGVSPQHRGRGLGKLLKASMLKFLRSKYRSVEWVVTGNANSNDPMLHINRALGFKTYRESSAYQISREELAKRLGISIMQ